MIDELAKLESMLIYNAPRYAIIRFIRTPPILIFEVSILSANRIREVPGANQHLLKPLPLHIDIRTNYLKMLGDGKHVLEVTYDYDSEKVVAIYEDKCVIRLYGYADKTKLVFPKEINDFTVKDIGINIEKESEKIFSIEPTIAHLFGGNYGDIIITTESSALTNGKVINGLYVQDILNQYVNNYTHFFIFLFLIILLWVISYVLTKKPKFNDVYTKETELILDPVLSEALIDSKIGAKELIMTCVLSAIKKGAIEVIDNSDM